MPRQIATKKAATKKSASPSSKATATKKSTETNSGAEEHSSLLEKLFVDMLKDMLWAEKHLVGALTNMQESATTPELQDAFEDHRFATQKHVSRLEKVFKLLGREAEEKKCDAMEGLTKEAQAIIDETKEGTMTRDAALIIAAQKVEHYEIASYGSLVQLARTMDNEEVARILEKTLWEEEDTDILLTDIAESAINPLADEETDEDGEEAETDATTFQGADSITNI
jgi:ferritin-like metal-binding protein YciE